MAYIGRGTDKISNIEVLDNITFDGSSSYSITKSSVAFVPNSAQSCLISIDGVVQATNFTVSTSTIDFGVAIAGTSTCDFFLHYGTGLITVPADGTVTTAKIANDAVTKDKVSNLMYPAFFASLSANQTGLTDNVYTKAQCDTEILDTDGYYDNSTNYRFTPLVAGKYYVYGQVTGDTANSNLVAFDSALYKNGSLLQTNYSIFSTNYAASQSLSIQSIVDMNGTTDYLELFGRVNVLSGTTIVFFGEDQLTSFGAFRIGD